MKTVASIFSRMTDSKAIMRQLKEMLVELDPCYGEEDAKFLAVSTMLEENIGGSTTPSAAAYLAAMEQKMSYSAFLIRLCQMWNRS